MPARFRVRTALRSGPDALVVCTGNVCRSPFIAARLSTELPDLGVESAGTGALIGSDMTPEVRELLRRRGVDADPHSARQLTRGALKSARMIVTATRKHRVWIVATDRGAADRTFTLKELARAATDLAPGSGVDELLSVAIAHAHTEMRDHDDDLDDPYGEPFETYERMAEEADAALAVLLPVLREATP